MEPPGAGRAAVAGRRNLTTRQLTAGGGGGAGERSLPRSGGSGGLVAGGRRLLPVPAEDDQPDLLESRFDRRMPLSQDRQLLLDLVERHGSGGRRRAVHPGQGPVGGQELIRAGEEV